MTAFSGFHFHSEAQVLESTLSHFQKIFLLIKENLPKYDDPINKHRFLKILNCFIITPVQVTLE